MDIITPPAEDVMPVMVDGARISSQRLRAMEWLAGGGAAGALGEGFRVVATPVPSGNVLIRAGAITMSGVVAGSASRQAYTAHILRDLSIPIPANTTANPLTRGVWVRARDAQYQGGVVSETDPSWDVIVRSEGEPLPQAPCSHLATVTLPPFTGAVTESMLTDRRSQLPLESSFLRTMRPSTTGTTVNGSVGLDASRWRQFPSAAPYLTVPTWAQRAEISASVRNIVFDGRGLTTGGNTWPRPTPGGATSSTLVSRIRLGALVSPLTELTGYAQQVETRSLDMSWTADVASVAGHFLLVEVQAGGKYSTHVGAMWAYDPETSATFDIRFYPDRNGL